MCFEFVYGIFSRNCGGKILVDGIHTVKYICAVAKDNGKHVTLRTITFREGSLNTCINRILLDVNCATQLIFV